MNNFKIVNNIQKRHSALIAERSTWINRWQDIQDYIVPNSGRFYVTDRNKGTKKNNQIYDNTATKALRILTSGMMSGMTSPARPWFKLTTPDRELAKTQSVKVWLSEVESLINRVFHKSNTYRTLEHIYLELATFGTAVSIVVPDFDNVIHHYPLTVGEYCLAANQKGEIDTLYREFQMTISSLVQMFGYEACSRDVQQMYDSGDLEAWRTIVHVIEPRQLRDLNKKDSKNMPFKSIYYERGNEEQKFLRESGFNRFPVLAPRWSVNGSGDVYGTNSPGYDALGDIKQLQFMQLRKAQAIDYKTNPPLQVPNSLKNRDVEYYPAGITFFDQTGPQNSVKTLFDVNLDINHLLVDIQDVRQRINSAFYADLFLMFAGQESPEKTAFEISQLKEEKLLMLGPMLERFNNECLSKLVNLTFDYCAEAGILPPAPLEIQGQELDIEFVSMLAQAQKSIGSSANNMYVAALGQVAQLKPAVLQNLDEDKWAMVQAEKMGVDPTIIKSPDQVQFERMQQAAAQAAMARVQGMQIAAQSAKDLSQADTANKNALTDMVNNSEENSI